MGHYDSNRDFDNEMRRGGAMPSTYDQVADKQAAEIRSRLGRGEVAVSANGVLMDIDVLRREVEVLGQQLTSLVDALGPILRPPPPDTIQKDGTNGSDCTVGEMIAAQIRIISTLARIALETRERISL